MRILIFRHENYWRIAQFKNNLCFVLSWCVTIEHSLTFLCPHFQYLVAMVPKKSYFFLDMTGWQGNRKAGDASSILTCCDLVKACHFPVLVLQFDIPVMAPPQAPGTCVSLPQPEGAHSSPRDLLNATTQKRPGIGVWLYRQSAFLRMHIVICWVQDRPG